MNKIISFLLLLLLCSSCIGAGTNSRIYLGQDDYRDFPSVVGINLQGDQIKVPTGLYGEHQLIVVAFDREQQGEVNRLKAKHLRELKVRYEDLRFYELPVIAEASPLYRFYVNNGMRIGVSGDSDRRSTITVYTDVSRFTEALGIAGNEVTGFVLNRQGEIVEVVQ